MGEFESALLGGVVLKIAYLAKHDSGGNDDEGAIVYALERLGHEVIRVPERMGKWASKVKADFLLCHHWHDDGQLDSVSIPKVFWCFDLISWPHDPALARRHRERQAWIADMTRRCDIGFCTDGDHVAKDKTGKLHWLMQGADEREVVKWTIPIVRPVDVLFVGGLGYGREGFVSELRNRYGNRFKHIAKGYHGAALEYEIRSAKIVVAPDSPVTDRYWSNRVYNILRLGGFLLHPLKYLSPNGMCKGLGDQYPYGGLGSYESREDMHAQIASYLKDDVARKEVAMEGQKWTLLHHTYRHRVERLIQIVKEKLCLK